MVPRGCPLDVAVLIVCIPGRGQAHENTRLGLVGLHSYWGREWGDVRSGPTHGPVAAAGKRGGCGDEALGKLNPAEQGVVRELHLGSPGDSALSSPCWGYWARRQDSRRVQGGLGTPKGSAVADVSEPVRTVCIVHNPDGICQETCFPIPCHPAASSIQNVLAKLCIPHWVHPAPSPTPLSHSKPRNDHRSG